MRGRSRRSNIDRSSVTRAGAEMIEPLEMRRMLSVYRPGLRDVTFGMRGWRTINLKGVQAQTAVMMNEADGKVLVGGTVAGTGKNAGDVALLRLNANGRVDASFSRSVRGTSENEIVSSIARASDGRVLLGGYFSSRLTKGGSLERQAFIDVYLATGAFSHRISPSALEDRTFSAMRVLGDDRVLVVGQSDGADGLYVAKVSLDGTGALDATFNAAATPGYRAIPSMFGGYADLAVQDDGGILVSGDIEAEVNNKDFAVARLTDDGVLDMSFGHRGIARLGAGSFVDRCTSIALDGERIVLGGSTSRGSGEFPVVARMLLDGSTDTSFGFRGVYAHFLQGGIKDIAVQEDGRIVAVGQTGKLGNSRLIMIRVNGIRGTRDFNFDGKDGTVDFDFFKSSARGERVALQADGRVLVAGTAGATRRGDLVVARFFDRQTELDVPDGFLQPAAQRTSGQAPFILKVRYEADAGIETSSIGDGDLMVTDAKGRVHAVEFASLDSKGAGSPRIATYRVNAPGGTWDFGDNGRYTVAIGLGAVKDVDGKLVPAGTLGDFNVQIFAQVRRGVLEVIGTDGNDTIRVHRTAGMVVATVNGRRQLFTEGAVRSISASGFDGDDQITVAAPIPSTLSGGIGNDRLTGGAARDTLSGGSQNDTLFARDGSVDVLDGGSEMDHAEVDAADQRRAIEALLL